MKRLLCLMLSALFFLVGKPSWSAVDYLYGYADDEAIVYGHIESRDSIFHPWEDEADGIITYEYDSEGPGYRGTCTSVQGWIGPNYDYGIIADASSGSYHDYVYPADHATLGEPDGYIYCGYFFRISMYDFSEKDMYIYGDYNTSGSGGNDQLYGWGTDDYLNGCKGADYLVGASGYDDCDGGDGSDDCFCDSETSCDD